VRSYKFFPLWMKGGKCVGSCEGPHVGVKHHRFLALSWTKVVMGKLAGDNTHKIIKEVCDMSRPLLPLGSKDEL
jgi:hypothetical protein